MSFPRAARVRQVSCGFLFTAAVDTDGVLYTWGLGEYHRLGHGFEDDEEAPRAVAALVGRRVRSVSCGNTHGAAVTEDGQLWTWGADTTLTGLLGRLDESDFEEDKFDDTPVRVTIGLPGAPPDVQSLTDGISDSDDEHYGDEPEPVREVCCGRSHTVVVMMSGEVCTFGDPHHGVC